jgi:hypothetical protein
MRMIGLMALGMVALAGVGRAEEIYRWTDAAGGVHYSNMPTVGAHRVHASPETAADAATSADDEAAFSTATSLRRNALQRDLRATDTRLRAIDRRLATLARARGRLAAGSPATGGVGTLAAQVESEEEHALKGEREQLAQHADELRSAASKLREEVSARFGSTPAWWTDVR